MLKFLWHASRRHRLMPWRSPYFRWRIETYWGIEADAIDFRIFCHFSWQHRRDLFRFLRWAGRMQRMEE